MHYSKLSEPQLIELLLKRDESGFNYLYENYSHALYGVILKIIYFNEEANDVLQETFVKIWNAIEQYDEKKGTLYTWMLNIARNTAIDKLKSKNFQNDLKNQNIPEFVTGIKQLTTEQKNNLIGIHEVVNQLKEEYKIIIFKAYFGGCTQKEIAEDLDLPLGTVKTRTRAALLELGELLKEFKENRT